MKSNLLPAQSLLWSDYWNTSSKDKCQLIFGAFLLFRLHKNESLICNNILMPKKEIVTDFRVKDMLVEADIEFTPQWSSIKEIDEALKSASKSGSGKVWFPEFTAVVKDFLIVIEDKADTNFHKSLDDNSLISMDVQSVKNYALNWALHYWIHLAKNTSYNKIIAIWISWDEKKHKMTPLYINDRWEYTELNDIETMISFSEKNIEEYYTKEILKEETREEKQLEEIQKDASELHNDLRNYWSIQDKDKPLIVSWILLALEEIQHKNFDVDDLNWDTINTDWNKIYKAIEDNLKRARVSPDVKRDKMLNKFQVIVDTKKINEKNSTLWKTPLKHYTEFIYEHIYKSIKYHNSSEDYVGRFYSEFMSYSWWDGQSLWIVLTPKHITDLFCELVDLQPTDTVFDPCCGTAGFLIAAMHYMISKTDDANLQDNIKQYQLHWIELQSYMFTIATTNMILRWDGKSNIVNDDFLRNEPSQLQLKWCTVGMMNPPYSQWSSKDTDLYEISFTEHLLDSLVKWWRALVIVPQSTFTGKTTYEKSVKENILKKHTLEWVITLNKDSFYWVGTNPCIWIFTTGKPHNSEKECKFINFENDWYAVQKHRWLVETAQALDKKQHLLDVRRWEKEAETKFCVNTTIEASDERLHSFYYFNDEIPTEEEFEKTIAEYLTFEFSMISQWRDYLFIKELDDE